MKAALVIFAISLPSRCVICIRGLEVRLDQYAALSKPFRVSQKVLHQEEVGRVTVTLTKELRQSIRDSDLSIRDTAKLYKVSPSTVQKIRVEYNNSHKIEKISKNKSLSPIEEYVCVSFKEQTLLPIDDCLYALRSGIKHLTRSTLYRTFKKYGVNDGSMRCFNGYYKELYFGFIRVCFLSIPIREGLSHFYFAIDDVSKFSYSKIVSPGENFSLSSFVKSMIREMPFAIRSIFIDLSRIPQKSINIDFFNLINDNKIDIISIRNYKNNHDNIEFTNDMKYIEWDHEDISKFIEYNNVIYNNSKLKTLNGKSPKQIIETWRLHSITHP